MEGLNIKTESGEREVTLGDINKVLLAEVNDIGEKIEELQKVHTAEIDSLVPPGLMEHIPGTPSGFVEDLRKVVERWKEKLEK